MADPQCSWTSPNDWTDWSQWLAAGLHARNRCRLPLLLLGVLFAQGRRTVTTWLRGAGISDDFQDYYYFLSALGRKTESVATQLVILILRELPLPERLLLIIDDSPTKRYGPHVEGTDVHHNRGRASVCSRQSFLVAGWQQVSNHPEPSSPNKRCPRDPGSLCGRSVGRG